MLRLRWKVAGSFPSIPFPRWGKGCLRPTADFVISLRPGPYRHSMPIHFFGALFVHVLRSELLTSESNQEKQWQRRVCNSVFGAQRSNRCPL